jgi:hypothetical protein
MTDTHKIEVVALVADPSILTFYKLDGSVYTVTQGDPRGKAMSEEFLAQREAGKEVITLFTGEDNGIRTSHLASAKRNPLIRFFRAPLAAIKKLLGTDEAGYDPDLTEEQHAEAAAKVRELAARLMKGDKHTAPESTDDLPIRMVDEETPLGKDETVIAVTDDGIVPQVENLSDQFVAADEGKAPSNGADNLILRVTKMGGRRKHSAGDLMGFLKHVDLPILEDGAFLAYKRLLHKGDGVYVDPHTGKVHQRIGDIVEMDESMVDPDRRRDCSNGLHVGSRQYMGSFHAGSGGAGTMLVLVQPEDAIAVPSYGTTKLRACRYEILGDLSNKAHDLVNNNKSVTDCKDTMDLIAGIVAGARPPKLGVVRIGGSHGSNLSYTIRGEQVKTDIKLEDARRLAKSTASAPNKPVTPVRTIDDSKNGNEPPKKLEKVRTKDAVVKPTDLKAKAEAVDAVVASGGSERVKLAAQLYARMTDKQASDADRRQAAVELKAHKQKTKVSYAALGLPDKAGTELQDILDIVPPTAPTPAPKAAPKPSNPAPSKPQAKKPEPVKTAPQPKAPVKMQAKPEPKAEAPKAPQNETRGDTARRLWSDATNSKLTGNHRKQALQELVKFKRAAKVSWEKLGLYTHTVEAEMKKQGL